MIVDVRARLLPHPGLLTSSHPIDGLSKSIWCPRWDSNPHCRRFELRSSAGWDTGTGPPNRIPTTLSGAETGMPVRDWSRGESGVTDGREAAPARRRVLIAEDEALIRLDLR